MQWSPSFECQLSPDGAKRYVVGHELVDEFLEFVAARARPNTVRAYAHDLCVFFTVVGKDPDEVTTKDVLSFVTAQRRPRTGAENVVRISTARRGCRPRPSSVAWLRCRPLWLSVTRDDTTISANPVPRGIVDAPEPWALGQGAAARARRAALAADPRPR